MGSLRGLRTMRRVEWRDNRLGILGQLEERLWAHVERHKLLGTHALISSTPPNGQTFRAQRKTESVGAGEELLGGLTTWRRARPSTPSSARSLATRPPWALEPRSGNEPRNNTIDEAPTVGSRRQEVAPDVNPQGPSVPGNGGEDQFSGSNSAIRTASRPMWSWASSRTHSPRSGGLDIEQAPICVQTLVEGAIAGYSVGNHPTREPLVACSVTLCRSHRSDQGRGAGRTNPGAGSTSCIRSPGHSTTVSPKEPHRTDHRGVLGSVRRPVPFRQTQRAVPGPSRLLRRGLFLRWRRAPPAPPAGRPRAATIRADGDRRHGRRARAGARHTACPGRPARPLRGNLDIRVSSGPSGRSEKPVP